MCSKDRDAAGNIAESERRVLRRLVDVIVVVDVRPRRLQEVSIDAEDVGGPGDTEVEEGEGT